MNIYRKDNNILVSKNGKPDGWEFLGSDDTLTDTTRKYVTGFHNGKAILDTAKLEADNQKELEIARKKKIKEIVDKHDFEISKGCVFEGKVFKCDGDTRSILREKIEIGNFPVVWITLDRKSSLSLDQTKAQNLLNAMRSYVEPIKIERAQKEVLVYSKNLIDEINSITV